ncbi:TIGR01458 family HAD-type hydrolase [Ruegeria sp. Ofav3-42]|uniref:TIGR01458 family HAD-type hydrolase n=1 Tax=Ruegeria sp. Ofav3-42 TaxID=2917759 RepID=UPI001EF67247|nr:TIGR01458 family HAD-type hydrolase [Ruegeria sp. Ofav3-42]MCG7522797.1 TIGR01458 family HAD-type hydrolase [Ruegeria sp. Ofav3-42]
MIQTVLVDVSGVLYQGAEVVPGAVEALARLRSSGRQVRCLTNSTRQPKHRIMAKLHNLGFAIRPEEVFTPVAAVLDWLVRTGHSPHLLVHPELEEEFSGCDRSGPLAVIVGDAAEEFSYESMNRAYRLLQKGAPLIALAKNRVFMDKDGQLSLDAGCFVKALEHATGARARLFGKPDSEFFRAAIASTRASPAQSAMIGDDAESDIAGALAAGAAEAYLVRTGKFREGDETRFAPEPTATVDDICEAVAYLTSSVSLKAEPPT